MRPKLDNFMAVPRQQTDGRGNVVMFGGHACSHYETIPVSEASEEHRLMLSMVAGDRDQEIPDTPAMREAARTFVGCGYDAEGQLMLAVCHHPRCYPGYLTDQQIAAAEAFVHEVVTNRDGITATTVAGPKAYCEKVCYSTTPHFYDIEVWDQPEDRPAGQSTMHFGGDNVQTLSYPARPAGRKFQIVLRCENCHHGYHLVTKQSSPSRWRRLMKNECARKLLAGAEPHREPDEGEQIEQRPA